MATAVTLALTGDVMLGRMANMVLLQNGPSYPWGNVRPYLQSPELTLVNLECVIATRGEPWARWHKVFHFRADPMALTALQIAGVDGVVLANNHVLDYEEEALLEMLDLLEKNGMPYTGAGRNREEASRPMVLDAGGLRVGVVAFTDNEPGWAATASTPGTNWIPISLEEKSLRPVRESIDRARQAGADLVVFSNHWGPNMVARPSRLFREFARAVMDAGADIYYGHSAHVCQGIEIYQGRPILYDTGDFVDDYAVDPELRNDRSLLFHLRLTPNGVERIDLIPVKIDYCQVNLARGADWEAIAQRITSLSAEMGTEVHRKGEQLWVEC
ncbi:MAG TPA: CapA family protein [Chthonomonadales bacterium]|nr:CapA family protein [Chthonomonadales bacterium]